MNLINKQFNNLHVLFFKELRLLKEYIENNFEEVKIEKDSDKQDVWGCYHLSFESKLVDYIIYYVKTENGNVVVVDAIPFNK